MVEHLEAVLLGSAREHESEHDDRLVHNGNAQRKGAGRRELICKRSNSQSAQWFDSNLNSKAIAPFLLGLKSEQGSCSMAPLPEALFASS